MFTATFAEEDCEESIVRTLLGLGDRAGPSFAAVVIQSSGP